ncbi:hypothetical protein PT931_13500 [Longispora urticae]
MHMVQVRITQNGKTAGKRTPVGDLKKAVLMYIAKGESVSAAVQRVGRTMQAYALWRGNDPEFAARVDALRKGVKKEVPDFPEFCEKYLGQKLWWHQLQWFDMLEGRPPRDLHPAQTYEEGEPNYLLINTPPEHAKSTSITVNYVTWRIAKDPNIRVVVVSKSADMAKQFLYSIKTRLDHPKYNRLAQDIGPVGGWKENAAIWSSDQIYLGGDERDSGEKDPTVQALGIGGHLYGARSDLIILDDCVVLSNAAEYEKQLRWVQQEVMTRLGPSQKLLVVGTRVDSIDLYRELLDGERYPLGVSPWTYMKSPAVLEFADDPADWVTLWPKNSVPWLGSKDVPGEDGLYPRWDGKYLAKRRNALDAKTWSMCYQQMAVSEDAIFSPEHVRAAVNGMRFCGKMSPDTGVPGIRERGMEGLYVIGGLDPAMTGDTAMVVLAIDRQTSQRWVLDVQIRTAPTPTWIRETVKTLSDSYGIHEWRVEKNAFQIFLTQDPELNKWLGSRGIILAEHFTGRNKMDVEWGVASMAPLFSQKLINLPSTRAEPVRMLVDQLITWQPQTKGKTDAVMALWFAEIRARELVIAAGNKREHNFAPNRFLTNRGKAQQIVVNLNDFAAVQMQR